MTDSPSPHPRCPKSILVGTDYTAESLHAAIYALELARTFSARVHLIHAWAAPYAPIGENEVAASQYAGVEPSQPAAPDHPNLLALMRGDADAQMAAFQASLRPDGVKVTTSVESGDPRTVLLHYSENHAFDWVVLGKRKQSAVAEWLLGDVAAYVVRHCQVPVLVVPREEAP